MIKVYETNAIGTDYVCGDIHGCFPDLEIALEKLGFDKAVDRLFTVGDIADRGHHSYLALEYLQKDWFHTVLGNHEEMLLQCHEYRNEQIQWHISNGGEWFTKQSREYKYDYIKLLQDLPIIIRVGDYAIAHASFPENCSWADIVTTPMKDKLKEYILWNRYMENVQCAELEKIYVGHTIVAHPTRYGKVEIIDTGCFVQHKQGYGYDHYRLTIKKLGE